LIWETISAIIGLTSGVFELEILNVDYFLRDLTSLFKKCKFQAIID
jgi:hypothetical protein